MKHYDDKRMSKCCNAPVFIAGDNREGTHYYVCDKCGKPCDSIEIQTVIYKAGIIRDEEGLLKIFKEWIKHHPDVFNDMDTFWYVQNAVGDLLGWSKEYSNFISKLIKKYDGKIS